MKIIGVGLSKTGTTSLDKCFQILGYKSVHWGPRATQYYVDGKLNILEAEYFDKFDAFSDYPWSLLYEHFDQNYDCKFILTMRINSEAWFMSIRNHIKTIGHFDTGRLVYNFEDPDTDRQKMLDFYWRHNGQVLEYFRGRDNFIEMCFEAGDGWIKLCDFLGVPISCSELRNMIARLPGSIPAFPHENQGSEMNPKYKGLSHE